MWLRFEILCFDTITVSKSTFYETLLSKQRNHYLEQHISDRISKPWANGTVIVIHNISRQWEFVYDNVIWTCSTFGLHILICRSPSLRNLVYIATLIHVLHLGNTHYEWPSVKKSRSRALRTIQAKLFKNSCAKMLRSRHCGQTFICAWMFAHNHWAKNCNCKLKLQIAIPGSGSMSYTCNRGKSSEPDKVGYRSDKAFICAASKKILSFIYERPMSNLANYSNK